MSYLLLRADARTIPLADESVHCVITSPPFYGLRDYGTAQWTGGSSDCDHIYNHGAQGKSGERADRTFTAQAVYRDKCRKCGAVRVDRQIGLEQTPDEYVEAMVQVFREVRRVLRPDGCVWANWGDSYASGGMGGHRKGASFHGHDSRNGDRVPKKAPPGLKDKDLCMIPARVAIGLQADGWWIRSEVIWSKNAMPESVTDRPTRSHESIFLLTKSKNYFYDAVAIQEPSVRVPHARQGKHQAEQTSGPMDQNGYSTYDEGQQERIWAENGMRNKRSVWSIPTQPWRGAHFAVMPRALVEPCVKSGTSEKGCCPKCAAPWERILDRYRTRNGERVDDLGAWTNDDPGSAIGAQGDGHWRYATVSETKGWAPTCECGAGAPVPCTVLDPFSGAATTGVVAVALGRNYVGMDLSAKYLKLSKRRIERPHAPIESSSSDSQKYPLFRE